MPNRVDCFCPFLPVSLRVTPRAAVAHSDVELAVRSEGHHPAVVIGEGLIDREHDLLAGGVSVVDDGEAVSGVAGMKGQAEEPLFAAGRDLGADVEERSRQRDPLLHDLDGPGLLHDEDPGIVARRAGDQPWEAEAPDIGESEPAGGWWWRGAAVAPAGGDEAAEEQRQQWVHGV